MPEPTFQQQMVYDVADSLAEGRSVYAPAVLVHFIAEQFYYRCPGVRVLVGVYDGRAGPEAVDQAHLNATCWMVPEREATSDA